MENLGAHKRQKTRRQLMIMILLHWIAFTWQ